MLNLSVLSLLALISLLQRLHETKNQNERKKQQNKRTNTFGVTSFYSLALEHRNTLTQGKIC